MHYKDQLKRTITLKHTPKRIICLVPSITELICDLGLESSLVGITKFCVHPKHILTIVEVVGGTKQVHYDKIRELKPDIILCNKEENTQEMINELETISTVHISDVDTVSDCLELIEMFGEIFNCSEKANDLVVKIRKASTDFEAYISTKETQVVAYFIWKDPWMVAANNTFVNYMLSLNNFKNAFENESRYPEISLDKIYADVNLVLLSSEPYPFKNEHKMLIQSQFPSAEFILVDGEMFSWYGSRLVLAFDYFKTLHYTALNS
ncbi:ABC transporter substrate-binding protein [Bizionia myxarmorum]|uniref:ABC transporter substrate-binding protein n=1 Tax=Bizionia myxarmorum TaxID=291186 RepID=A0A5D0RCX9_9FLAO|nr:helical backbone metal receptor [Bizionia myxarmorum]TYB79530.1 ABC transporter substrate-binding protein [Bizionia myxarmorum]